MKFLIFKRVSRFALTHFTMNLISNDHLRWFLVMISQLIKLHTLRIIPYFIFFGLSPFRDYIDLATAELKLLNLNSWNLLLRSHIAVKVESWKVWGVRHLVGWTTMYLRLRLLQAIVRCCDGIIDRWLNLLFLYLFERIHQDLILLLNFENRINSIVFHELKCSMLRFYGLIAVTSYDDVATIIFPDFIVLATIPDALKIIVMMRLRHLRILPLVIKGWMV